MRLDDVPIPEGAEERAWGVVRTAFEEREPAPRERHLLRPALVLAAVAALAGVAASPPGRAVLDSLREAVGVKRAQPALFSLPAPGQLLVVSAERGGAWVVRADGSKRRLGNYDDLQWSPHGLFVVATKRNELLALTPDGKEIRWTLARRDVASPRWGGTRTDTRIAYVARSGLRVVAGDGTGDRLLDAFGGLPAWRPGAPHQLAHVAGTAFVVLEAVDDNRVLWRAPQGREPPIELAWSADGERLLLVSPHELRVLNAEGRLMRRIRVGALALDAQWAPRGHVFALHLRHEPPGALEETDRRSEVRLIEADHPGRSRQLFAGSGVFGGIAWSPDERWLLVDWGTANQWLFLRVRGRSTVRAVANIAEQFPRPDGRPPLLLVHDRWCCAS